MRICLRLGGATPGVDQIEIICRREERNRLDWPGSQYCLALGFFPTHRTPQSPQYDLPLSVLPLSLLGQMKVDAPRPPSFALGRTSRTPLRQMKAHVSWQTKFSVLPYSESRVQVDTGAS